MLPVDLDSEDYRFHKTLHQDIELKQDEWGSKWDMQFENGDVVNITGEASLKNAICIVIMTRFRELNNDLYTNFGCRIHELIKANASEMVKRKLEYYTEDVLKKMRRVHKVNEIIVNKIGYGYKIYFHITSISDISVEGEVQI